MNLKRILTQIDLVKGMEKLREKANHKSKELKGNPKVVNVEVEPSKQHCRKATNFDLQQFVNQYKVSINVPQTQEAFQNLNLVKLLQLRHPEGGLINWTERVQEYMKANVFLKVDELQLQDLETFFICYFEQLQEQVKKQREFKLKESYQETLRLRIQQQKSVSLRPGQLRSKELREESEDENLLDEISQNSLSDDDEDVKDEVDDEDHKDEDQDEEQDDKDQDDEDEEDYDEEDNDHDEEEEKSIEEKSSKKEVLSKSVATTVKKKSLKSDKKKKEEAIPQMAEQSDQLLISTTTTSTKPSVEQLHPRAEVPNTSTSLVEEKDPNEEEIQDNDIDNFPDNQMLQLYNQEDQRILADQNRKFKRYSFSALFQLKKLYTKNFKPDFKYENDYNVVLDVGKTIEQEPYYVKMIYQFWIDLIHDQDQGFPDLNWYHHNIRRLLYYKKFFIGVPLKQNDKIVYPPTNHQLSNLIACSANKGKEQQRRDALIGKDLAIVINQALGYRYFNWSSIPIIYTSINKGIHIAEIDDKFIDYEDPLEFDQMIFDFTKVIETQNDKLQEKYYPLKIMMIIASEYQKGIKEVHFPKSFRQFLQNIEQKKAIFNTDESVRLIVKITEDNSEYPRYYSINFIKLQNSDVEVFKKAPAAKLIQQQRFIVIGASDHTKSLKDLNEKIEDIFKLTKNEVPLKISVYQMFRQKPKKISALAALKLRFKTLYENTILNKEIEMGKQNETGNKSFKTAVKTLAVQSRKALKGCFYDPDFVRALLKKLESFQLPKNDSQYILGPDITTHIDFYLRKDPMNLPEIPKIPLDQLTILGPIQQSNYTLPSIDMLFEIFEALVKTTYSFKTSIDSTEASQQIEAQLTYNKILKELKLLRERIYDCDKIYKPRNEFMMVANIYKRRWVNYNQMVSLMLQTCIFVRSEESHQFRSIKYLPELLKTFFNISVPDYIVLKGTTPSASKADNKSKSYERGRRSKMVLSNKRLDVKSPTPRKSVAIDDKRDESSVQSESSIEVDTSEPPSKQIKDSSKKIKENQTPKKRGAKSKKDLSKHLSQDVISAKKKEEATNLKKRQLKLTEKITKKKKGTQSIGEVSDGDDGDNMMKQLKKKVVKESKRGEVSIRILSKDEEEKKETKQKAPGRVKESSYRGLFSSDVDRNKDRDNREESEQDSP